MSGIGGGTGDPTLNTFSGSSHYSLFIIDVNGIDGPNMEGQDQLRLRACLFTPSTDCGAVGPGFSGRTTSGSIYPTDLAANTALWESIFNES